MFIELNRGQSFKGLAQYCLHDVGSDTSDRVDFVQTRNLSTDNPQVAWRVMASRTYIQEELKAENGVGPQGRKGKPVGHMLISWGKDEADAQELDEDRMMQSVDGALKAIGAEDRQAMVIAHNDTAERSPHCHVIINLIGDDGRLLKNYNERLKLSRFSMEEEIRVHGKPVVAERQKRWHDRDAGETPAPMKKKARHLYEIEKASEQDNEKAIVARDLLERQKKIEQKKQQQQDRQTRNRERLREIRNERERRIKAQNDGLIRRAKTNARKIYADPWREMHADHQKQIDAFDAKEKGVRGSIENGLKLFDWKAFFDRSAEARSTGVKELFQMITSENARRETLLKKQEEERQRMRDEQRKAEREAATMAKQLQSQRLDENKRGYVRKAKAMKVRQECNAATLKEQQKNITAERNEALKQYREQLAEQKKRQIESEKLRREFEAAAARAWGTDKADEQKDGDGKQEGDANATVRKPRRERKPRDPSTSRRKRDVTKKEAEEKQRRDEEAIGRREAHEQEDFQARMMQQIRDQRAKDHSNDLER